MRIIVAAAILLAGAGAASAQIGSQSTRISPVSQADVDAAISAPMTVSPTVPSTGPGAGKCRGSTVPSNIIVSGGMVGTAGTCSLIVQCGTDATYVVRQFNVGSGC